jgi:3-hydroxyacyl-[acyl-carrier-protein] dehydratase
MKELSEDFTFDFRTVDFSQCVADLDAIRKVNPHRFEMELLSGIVMVDPMQHLIVGYKDTLETDFWCRGHMPGYPLMPGVLMLEAAAQMVSYYASTSTVADAEKIMGLAGIDDARFIKQIKPGDRLMLAAKGIKISRRIVRCRVIGAVNFEKCFECTISGVVLGAKKESSGA